MVNELQAHCRFQHCSYLAGVLTKLPCLRCKWQGFRYVASGPMVRSSYKAGEFYIKAMIEADRAKSTTAADSSA